MSKVKEAIKDQYDTQGKEIETIYIQSALTTYKVGETRHLDVITYSLAEVKIAGKKREEKFNITHVFCPFCGEKTMGEPIKADQ